MNEEMNLKLTTVLNTRRKDSVVVYLVLVSLDIDDDFKEHVEKFVSALLSSENLVVKKINGTEITGTALFEHFKVSRSGSSGGSRGSADPSGPIW